MTHREKLIRDVKLVGSEIMERAEEIVGKDELVSEFTIWLRFPQGITDVPEIEIDKTLISKNVLYVRRSEQNEQ